MEHSVLRRLFSAFLCIAMAVALLPVNVLANDEEPALTGTQGESVEIIPDESPTPTEESTTESETETESQDTSTGDTPETAGELSIAEVLPEEAEEIESDLPLDGATASGTCGSNLTWTLSDDGVLTISGTGEMYDYKSPADVPWCEMRTSIEKVVIQYGVTSIGDFAFYWCVNLSSITIKDSVTSIGKKAFEACTSLTNIIIPDGVTSIGYYAFYDCTSLTSVIIPDSVTNIMAFAFFCCSSLTSVTLPNKLTIIENYVFCDCKRLTSVAISESVTSVGACAFSGCSNLSYVYYAGTSDDWKDIEIGECNDPLKNAELFYLLTVTYNANGGSCSVSSDTVISGGTLNSLPTPTRTGYTFDGWYTAASGGTEVTTTTTFSADTTLYAHWTAHTYTVTYNANGGTGAPSSQTKTYGQTLTLSTTEPTRSGYTFLGWAMSSAATTTAYSAGSSYTINSSVTLYAVWEESGSAVLLGDVNEDGEVTIADAVRVARYDAGYVDLTDAQLAAADVNGDGEVTIADAVRIARYDAGYITEL